MNSQYYIYLISHFLGPLSLCVSALVLALLLIALNRARRFAISLMTIATFTLYAFSTPFVTHWLLAPLEYQYPNFAAAAKPLKYVVVLGCAHSIAPQLPASAKLERCNVPRVIEGLRLYRQMPGAKLVFTGGGSKGQTTLAHAQALYAQLMGVDSADIIQLNDPFNTEQEMVAIKALLADEPFALVTSAAHMPRAMYLAQGKKLNATAAPTDHLVRFSLDKLYLRYFIPEVSNLEKIDSAVHEIYGMWWLKLKGL